MRSYTKLVLFALAVSCGNHPELTPAGDSKASALTLPVFPVKYSPNKRYLVDHNGNPFPIMGRTAWALMSQPLAQAQLFIDDTVSHGYDAIEMAAPAPYVGGRAFNSPFNGNNDIPFSKRLDGNPWTGAITYTNINNEAPDFSTMNNAYWTLLDSILDYAAQKGVIVLLFPAYVGIGGNDGWRMEMAANGGTRMSQYGAAIAQRYVNRKNIVWMMGGDSSGFTDAKTVAEQGLLNGLQSVAGQQSTLFSAEWSGDTNGVDASTFGASMTLNSVYTWRNVIGFSRQAYSEQSAMPAFLLEEPYDQEGPDGTNLASTFAIQPVRRFQWWAWLSTIGGYVSGNGYVWPFQPDNQHGFSNGDDWHLHLNTTNTIDMGYLNAFMQSIAWYNLVPQGLGSQPKTLITSGAGTFAETDNSTTTDYVAAASSPDKLLLVAYVPPGHNGGSITVDMTNMAGASLARWFNPTSGTYTTIGSGLTNSGTMAFTTLGANSAGDKDWVLILSVTDSQAPTVPTNLTGAPLSSSQIQLSWTASTDNIAVVGYKIFRCQGAGCTPSALVATTASNAYTDSGLSSSTTYVYAVSAVDASNNSSAPSTAIPVATAAVDTSKPTVPTGLVATGASASQINLTWTASTDNVAVAGYQVFQCAGAGCSPTTQVATTTTPSYAATGLTAGGAYGFAVSAFDAANNTSAACTAVSASTSGALTIGETNISSFTTPDFGNGNWLLAQPATLTQTATLQSLSFYVTKGAGTLQLGVYSDNAGRPGTLLAQTAQLTPSTTAPAGFLTANVTAPATLQPGTYWLAYYPSSDGLSFLAGGTGGAKFYQIPTYGALPQTFSTGTLQASTNHWLFYATLNAGGGTLDTQKPTLPGSVTATAISSSQINLAWAASSDNVAVTGYNILRCQGSGCTPSTLLTTVTGTSYSNTGLTASTPYAYAVAAFDAANNTSASSTTASATTSAPPAITPPSVTTSSATGTTSTTATLNGSANPNGNAANGWFRYWTSNPGSCTDTSGTRIPATGGTALGNGTAAAAFSQPISGLAANTPYFFCALASNGGGTSTGLISQLTTAASGGTTTLLGVQNTTGSTDYNDNPNFFAQGLVATVSGSATSLSFYIDPASSTGQIVLGLYDASGANGGPGRLLAQAAAATSPTPGAWLTLPITSVAITNGATYWLAYEVTSSAIKYRTVTPGAGDEWSGPIYYQSLGFTTTLPSTYGATTNTPSGWTPWAFYMTVQ